MSAEEFLNFFEGRNFTVLLKNGSLAVEPFRKLNRDDHKTIAAAAADAEVRAALKRLLHKREEAQLSADQARAVDQVRTAFDATLIRIRPAEIRPGVPMVPARKEPEQPRIFAGEVSRKQAPIPRSATPGSPPPSAPEARCGDEEQDEPEPLQPDPPKSLLLGDGANDAKLVAEAKIADPDDNQNTEVNADLQPEIDPANDSDRDEYACTLCGRRTSDPGDFHCTECKGLLIPVAAVAMPTAEVVAPEAEPDRTEHQTRDIATDDEPITAEQIAEIERLAALVWPDDAEREPVPQIASVSASAGTDSTSSRPQKIRPGASMGHEIPDNAAPIPIATAVPAIPARVHKPVEREICVWSSQRPTNRRLVNQLDVAATSATTAAGLRVLVEELDSSTRPKWHTLLGPARLTRNGLQARSPRPMRLKLKY